MVMPHCGRLFERKGELHSCRAYLLAGHFKGRPAGRLLYEKLKEAVKKEIGSCKIESSACCIHFVSTFTFAAVKRYKDRIQVDFSSNRIINSKRVVHALQMSAYNTCMLLIF
jgi:hypothetical protein